MKIVRLDKADCEFQTLVDPETGGKCLEFREGKILVAWERLDTQGHLLEQRLFDSSGIELSYRAANEKGNLIYETIYLPKSCTETRRWNDAEILISEYHYCNSWKQGLCREWSDSGRLLKAVEYFEDKYHGLYLEYFDSKADGEQVKKAIHYERGVNHGLFETFYESGAIEERAHYQQGRRDGAHELYYPNQVLRQLAHYKNGELDGEFVEYFANGQKKSERHFTQGRQDGMEHFFSEKGLLMGRSYYEQGRSLRLEEYGKKLNLTETVQIFFESGLLHEEYTLVGGQLDGAYRNYHLSAGNSVLAREIPYRKGVKEGVERTFNKKGEPLAEVYYKKNQKQIEKVYFDGGRLQSEKNWSDRGQMERSLYFYQNRRVREEIVRISTDHLVIRQYSDRGQLQQIKTVLAVAYPYREILDGAFERYYSSGHLAQEGFFSKGREDGLWVDYDEGGCKTKKAHYQEGVVVENWELDSFGREVKWLRLNADGSVEEEEDIIPDNQGSAQISTTEIRPDEQVGSYKILRALGQGGMGTVFLAFDLVLEREVAIKFMRPDQNPLILEQLLNEGRALARLSHPNIVNVYSIGQHKNQMYLVMEHVDGLTLLKYLLNDFLGMPELVQIGLYLISALKAAHAGGVLHRDITPNNIILTRTKLPKLIDFGISKVLRVEKGGNEPSEMIMGTPCYISPEVARGGFASVESDVYSLGILFYEMFTGIRPFKAKNTLESLELTKSAALEFDELSRKLLPIDLQNLILSMTDKNLKKRDSDLDSIAFGLKSLDWSHLPPELQYSFPMNEGIEGYVEWSRVLNEQGLSKKKIGLVINLAAQLCIEAHKSRMNDTDDDTISIEMEPPKLKLEQSHIDSALVVLESWCTK